MTIEIVTSQPQSTQMRDIINVSLGNFLWGHVQRLFRVGNPDDISESRWREYEKTEPLPSQGYYVDFENQTAERAEFSKDYRNLLSVYFNVSEEEIKSATLVRYSPTDRPTLYDYPENYAGSCPSVEEAFLAVRDFFSKFENSAEEDDPFAPSRNF